jgi:hypothetical protein
MESNWAAEHLQVIRTLMERSALYRRALAPIMIFNGTIGLTAAAVGWLLQVASPCAFIVFWAGVSMIAVAGTFLLVRRQALKASEPFWSPPMRRVTQALLPPLVAGLLLSSVVLVQSALARDPQLDMAGPLWLPVLWVVLYGCAFHSAGFFMPRGMKVFGWGFILGGCGLFAVDIPAGVPPADYTYAIMGFFFGGLHLAYGSYLYFTEPRRNET